jgi:hypothetical protein
MCGLVSQASPQEAEPKFNSNADDVTKIRGVLEEFRQDIIRKDGYALTKLVLNPDVFFHHANTQEMVNLVVDDKIVIKCHQPKRTVLANLDIADLSSSLSFDVARSFANPSSWLGRIPSN